ncbi:unnamed protein product [Schistosoma turkestanicum]|nr:unnamed protein product [Schistosoma turkestanicum]
MIFKLVLFYVNIFFLLIHLSIQDDMLSIMFKELKENTEDSKHTINQELAIENKTIDDYVQCSTERNVALASLIHIQDLKDIVEDFTILIKAKGDENVLEECVSLIYNLNELYTNTLLANTLQQCDDYSKSKPIGFRQLRNSISKLVKHRERYNYYNAENQILQKMYDSIMKKISTYDAETKHEIPNILY